MKRLKHMKDDEVQEKIIEQIARKKSIYAISVWLRLKLASIVSWHIYN